MKQRDTLSASERHARRVAAPQGSASFSELAKAAAADGTATNGNERTRADAPAPAGEVRYHTLFGLVPVAVYSCDADGVISEYNQRAVELWGRAPRRGDPTERYCGSFKLFYADGRAMPHDECPMARVLRGETLAERDTEILVERPDGTRRTVLAHPESLTNAQGDIIGAINCLYDITERKQTEEALRASEAQLAAQLADTQQVQRISSQLIREGNLDSLYEQILAAAIAVMRSDMGSMQLLVPERNELRLLAQKGFDPASAAFWEWVDIASGSTCGMALRTGERVVVADVETCDFMAGTRDLDFCRLSSIRAVQSTPLVSRSGRVVGMISTHWLTSHQPAERELRLLDVLARQAADLIERKQTEQASAHLAAIVTSADDAIASKTLDGIVTSWNGSAERMFGYTAQEMVGQSILLLIPPDRHDEEDRILARLRVGERIEHFETVRVAKDGRQIEVSLTISPIRDSAGAVIGASKIVRDSTERKRMERLLAEQNALLELIASGCPLDECLTALTRAVARLEPRTRAAVLLADAARTTFPALYAADLPPSFVAGLKDAPISDHAIGTCGTAVYSGEPITCADIAHDERWSSEWRELCVAHGILACHSEPVIGTNGEPLASLMLGFDAPRAPSDWGLRIAHFGAHVASIAIERTREEEALRESEEKFRAMADNIPTLAWMARPDGHIFWYNRRWYEYTGTTPGSQEGWGWQSVHDPDVLPLVMERWMASLATGEPFEMVFPIKGADGVFRPFLTRGAPVRNGQGQIVRWFGTNTDIADQRATEEALRVANQVKDEFLGIASHELRTPLTSIQANIQLIEQRLVRLTASAAPSADLPLSEQALRERLAPLTALVERTERQMRRLNRLVGDLLDVTRIQGGKFNMRPEACDLVEIVREAVDEQRAAWPSRVITLDTGQRRHVPLHADADRLGQVVTNYLTNALKYSPPDQPVAVRVRLVDGQARVEVRDQGPGLTAEQQSHLFEQFYRAPGIRQQSGSGIGLGLGLSICRTIIERHGGQVGVTSAPGDGSTFWFFLPTP